MKMSQPYGQQPPGNFNQGPGYGGMPPGGMPGGMPPAPQEYSSGPIPRPGTVTTAAVLAFVQAGLTLICTVIVMIGFGAVSAATDEAESIGGVDIDEGLLAVGWALAFGGLIGGGLLIWGGIKALSGTAGQLLVIAAGVQILLCILWLAILGGGIVSVILAVMPIITLIMSLGGPAKQYEASRRG
jgi:hypothetical protein